MQHAASWSSSSNGWALLALVALAIGCSGTSDAVGGETAPNAGGAGATATSSAGAAAAGAAGYAGTPSSTFNGGGDGGNEFGAGNGGANSSGAGNGSAAAGGTSPASGGANGGNSAGGAGAGGMVNGAGGGNALTPRQKLLTYIASISGKKTLAGEHNRESTEGDFIQAMHDVTGHYPALWGGDFLFEANEIKNRPNVISHLMQGWQGGSMVSLMYHACPPTQGEACDWDGGVLSSLSDAEWSDLTTDGGKLNITWKSRLDAVVPYFQKLKDAGIAPLFRIHHEMNQGVFWWAGRKGPSGTAKLYQITHDYLVKTKGLDNIVWVWSVQDIWDDSTNSWNFDAYNPGPDYWDIMSLDFYDGKGYTADKYNAMLAEAGTKPIAIGECQTLPKASDLTAQPRWLYFLGWAELIQQDNSNSAITSVYTAGNVLTQDEMPGW
jgi:mannan endo-1,4-beta-mannosidase